MILLIRRRTLLILIFATIAFALAMSVMGYVSVIAAGELSAPERKVLAERILFAGIVGFSIVLAGLAVAAYDTIGLNSLLRRLSEMHRMSGDQLQLTLRRFGSVGDQLGNLYENINELSDRKSRRIAGMNSLLTTIVSRTERKMLIVNAAGEVYQATPEALEHLERSSSEVLEKSIDSVVEGESFSETAAALSRRAATRAIEGPDGTVAVIRVMGDQGMAAYYVYLLGNDAKEELRLNPPAEAEDESPEPRGEERRSAIKSFLANVSRRRR